MPQRRRSSPWSRRLLVIVVIVLLLLVPLWIDPQTLSEVLGRRGASPSPPLASPTSVASLPAAPDADPYGQLLASDDFSRTNDSGWGIASSDDAYAVMAHEFAASSVANGKGIILAGRDSNGVALLVTPETPDIEVSVTVAIDAGTSGSASAAAVARAADGSMYRARVEVSAAGSSELILEAVGEAAARRLAEPVALDARPGDAIHLRLRVAGSDPTTVSAQAWPAGATEPQTWQAVAIDWTGRLQHPGSAGVGWLVSGSPADLHFDDLSIATHAEAGR